MKVYEIHQITLTQDEYDSLPEQLQAIFVDDTAEGFAPGEATHSLLVKTGEEYPSTQAFAKYLRNIDTETQSKYMTRRFVLFPTKFKEVHIKSKSQTVIEFG